MLACIRFARAPSQSGMALNGVAISLGALGLLSVYMTQSLSVGMRGQKAMENRGDREAVRRMLMDRTDCSLTITTACTPGTLMPVYRQGSGGGAVPLISASVSTPTRYGVWALRSECNATGDGLTIRAATLAANGTLLSTNDADFVPDPLTRKITKWSNPQSLVMPSGVSLCPISSPPSSTAGDRMILTAYQGITSGDVEITVPAGFRYVDMSVYMNSILLSIMSQDGQASEDTAFIEATIDLAAETWSGMRMVTAGNGGPHTQNFIWNDESLGKMVNASDGDVAIVDPEYGTFLWMTNRPQASFNSTTRKLTISRYAVTLNSMQSSFIFRLHK